MHDIFPTLRLAFPGSLFFAPLSASTCRFVYEPTVEPASGAPTEETILAGFAEFNQTIAAEKGKHPLCGVLMGSTYHPLRKERLPGTPLSPAHNRDALGPPLPPPSEGTGYIAGLFPSISLSALLQILNAFPSVDREKLHEVHWAREVSSPHRTLLAVPVLDRAAHARATEDKGVKGPCGLVATAVAHPAKLVSLSQFPFAV